MAPPFIARLDVANSISDKNFFRSARASCTTSGEPVRTYALKILTPIYRHICLMNHQETHQTNPVQSSTAQYSLVTPSIV